MVARDYSLNTVVPSPGTPIGVATFGNQTVQIFCSPEWRQQWFERVGTALFGPTGEEDVTASIPAGSYVGSVAVAANKGISVSGTPAAGYTATLDLAQDIRTSATVTFANIVCPGIVDGRDVSVDGAKLDGIETGATADQTAAEILTAIKTVDGAGSGLDADLLDAQSGAFYLAWGNFTGTPTTLAGYGITDGATDTELSTAISNHEAAADPHTGYQKESEKDAANGYAGLNSSSRTTKGVDTTDDLIVDDATNGLVLKDTQGTPHYWRVTVDNTGVLVITDLGTTKP